VFTKNKGSSREYFFNKILLLLFIKGYKKKERERERYKKPKNLI